MTRRLLRLTWAGLALASILVAPASAVTKFEGQYQLMMDLRKSPAVASTESRFPWDFDSNNNDNYDGAELRILTTPRRNAEAFLKVEADWNSSNNETARPAVQFREAHLRYAWNPRPQQTVESFLFFRQDRFWSDSYLIRLVDNGSYGGNGSGIRVNTAGLLGMQSSFIISDFAGQSPDFPVEETDDAYVARVRKDFVGRQPLRLGFGFNRRVNHPRLQGEVPVQASTYAVDGRYQWKGVDYSLEYATTQSALTYLPTDAPDDWTGRISERATLQAEIRSFRLGNHRSGYLNIAPSAVIRGPLYDNPLANTGRDEVRWNLNGWYLVPERAITLSANYFDSRRTVTQFSHESELYLEAYLEFVNGFTGKLAYRSQDLDRIVANRPLFEEHDDIFAEVQVESRLAWLRIQGKVRDLGIPSQQELFNLDTAINFTDRLKLYNRFSFANDVATLRKGIFMQLQYRPTGNVEMYLEYGPGYIGDDSTPVNDGDLAGSGDQVDILKFILKGQF